MPLFIPVILGGAIIAGLGKGAAKGKEGIDATLEAKRIVDGAKAAHQHKLEELDAGGKFVARRFKELHDSRVEITVSTVTDFFEFLKKLERGGKRKETDKEGFSANDGSSFKQDFQGQFVDIEDMVRGGHGAYAAGAAAGQGAATLVGALGTASTGTAISGLSGAAAQSAFLAWLGGGSLAAGGGGMALGSIILGGIYVAPAALIGGFVLAKQSEKALTQAKDFESKVEVANEQVDGQVAFLRRAGKRIDELESLARRVAARADDVLSTLSAEDVLAKVEPANSHFEIMWSLMKALSEIWKVPIFTEDMDLTRESATLLAQYKDLP